MCEGQDKRGAASTAAAHTLGTGTPDVQYRQKQTGRQAGRLHAAFYPPISTMLRAMCPWTPSSLLAAHSLQTPGKLARPLRNQDSKHVHIHHIHSPAAIRTYRGDANVTRHMQ